MTQMTRNMLFGPFWRGKRARDMSDVSQAPSHPHPRHPPPYPPPPRSLSLPSSLVWDASRWWCTHPCLDGGGCDVAVRCIVLVKITINRKNRKKKNIPRAQETRWWRISWALFVLQGPEGVVLGPRGASTTRLLGLFFASFVMEVVVEVVAVHSPYGYGCGWPTCSLAVRKISIV